MATQNRLSRASNDVHDMLEHSMHNTKGNADDEARDSLFKAIDADGSGTIDRTEFIRLHKEIMSHAREEVKKEHQLEMQVAAEHRRLTRMRAISLVLGTCLAISIAGTSGLTYGLLEATKETKITNGQMTGIDGTPIGSAEAGFTVSLAGLDKLPEHLLYSVQKCYFTKESPMIAHDFGQKKLFRQTLSTNQLFRWDATNFSMVGIRSEAEDIVTMIATNHSDARDVRVVSLNSKTNETSIGYLGQEGKESSMEFLAAQAQSLIVETDVPDGTDDRRRLGAYAGLNVALARCNEWADDHGQDDWTPPDPNDDTPIDIGRRLASNNHRRMPIGKCTRAIYDVGCALAGIFGGGPGVTAVCEGLVAPLTGGGLHRRKLNAKESASWLMTHAVSPIEDGWCEGVYHQDNQIA